MVAAQVALGLAGAGSLGLILGHLVGQAAGFLALIRNAFYKDNVRIGQIRWQLFWRVANRYRQFPLYSTVSGLANSGSTELPVILLASLFSPSAAGLYMLANRVLQEPMSLLGQAVGQVFHAEAAHALRESRLDVVTLKAFKALLRLGTCPLLIFAFSAPEVFQVVFGKEWLQAGVFAQFIIPMVWINFVFGPLSVAGSVLERLPAVFLFQLALFFSSAAAMICGYALLHDLNSAILFFALANFLVNFFWMLWLFGTAGIQFRSWIYPFLQEIWYVSPVLVCLWLIKAFILHGLVLQNNNIPIISLTVLAILGCFVLRVMPVLKNKTYQ